MLYHYTLIAFLDKARLYVKGLIYLVSYSMCKYGGNPQRIAYAMSDDERMSMMIIID